MNVTSEELSIVVNNLPDVDYSFGIDENCSIDHDILSSSQNNENHGNAEDQMEDGELNDTESNAENSGEVVKASNDKKPVRQYLNKAGEFVVGIDLFSSEAKVRAEERIRRFGQVVRPDDIITDDVLSRLYKSLGVEGPGKDANIRYATVHVSGTDDLSTGDIFSYFQEFVPTSVEWINDQSCNVVWSEETTAARALLKLSQEMENKEEEEEKEEGEENLVANGDDQMSAVNGNDAGNDFEKMEVESASNNNNNNDDNDDPEDDDEDDDEEEKETGRYKGGRKTSRDDDNNNSAKDGDKQPMEDTCKEVEKERRHQPGKWRVGVAHPKTGRQLMMRYATMDDKKQDGANQKSKYYMKHGNPNYGGLRGLISKSWKQRYRRDRHQGEGRFPSRDPETNDKETNSESSRRHRQTSALGEGLGRKRNRWNDDIEEEEAEVEAEEKEHNDMMEDFRVKRKNVFEAPRSKLPRMRMYADEEEEEDDEDRDSKQSGNSRSDIRKRLGLKDDRRAMQSRNIHRSREDFSRSRR